MPKLIIVESPTKARTIEKILGNGYRVKATVGHIRDLPPKRLAVDVMHDFAVTYESTPEQQKTIKELREYVRKSDDVFLATDPDREGEAISWHAAYCLGLDPDVVKRVKFNEINKNGVDYGMSHPAHIDMNMVDAQAARRILDRLVGYKLSPFLRKSVTGGESAGRVQSVALRFIVDREAEIEKFVPDEYWSITAKLLSRANKRQLKAELAFDEKGKVKITSKDQSDAYMRKLDNAVYTVKEVRNGTRKKGANPPYTTSTMQQEASRRLGFTAQNTMKVAQQLFEGVTVAGYGVTGLITYMRTDSVRISDESRKSGEEYIRRTYGDKYLPSKPNYFKSKGRIQDGHEAIRPTIPELTPEQAKASLTPEQYKLYNLIWKRFMQSLMAECVQNTKNVKIEARREGSDDYCIFTASGYTVKFDGFTVMGLGTDAEDEKQSELPEVKEGEILALKELLPEQHFTQPPARYTEASLIKKMEETGIGRPSTYQSILTTLVKRRYITREKKQLIPTSTGREVVASLVRNFPNIVDAKFTADMESELDRVEEGDLGYTDMLSTFWQDFEPTLKAANARQKEDSRTDLVCPKCGGHLLVKRSKYGAFYACENWTRRGDGCDFKANMNPDGSVAEPGEDTREKPEPDPDVICPKCGKPMILRTSRFGSKFYGCSDYPRCRGLVPVNEEITAVCPKCGGKVAKRHSKRGRSFFGCSNYPECDFISSIDKPCPVCGSCMVRERGVGTHCIKEGCGYKVKKED